MTDSLVSSALCVLGKAKLVLAVHDVSFPSEPDEDAGRGSPYSAGARGLLAFARELGFDGLQLGPQGETSRDNPSPYDGAAFTKSVASIGLGELATPRFANLLSPSYIADIVSGVPSGDGRAHHAYAWEAHRAAVIEASSTLAARADEDARALRARVAAYAETEREWLAHDVAHEIVMGGDAEAFVLGQYVLSDQHARLRELTGSLGMKLYGDLQVGLAGRDTWQREDLFLERWRLGAPPSRTNPDGQAWGYPVFDPRRYRTGVVGFLEARMRKLFGEFDGVRIDHPHGLITPWVYDGDRPGSVASGARLFESPDHPDLAQFSVARPDQIDPLRPPYADLAVHDLDAAQVDAYATLVDALIRSAHARGRETSDILFEVLSTCPEPMRCVMERYGLGRFRVTQKSSPDDPRDVYRSDNAAPRDWIMIGSHDTEPLQRVMDRWEKNGSITTRARYLTERLGTPVSEDRRRLGVAMLAELFASPAENVMVFWADLFGERNVYNTPGVPSPDNWVMRIPRNYREIHSERLARGESLDVHGALAAALRARGLDPALAEALDARATVRLHR